MMASPQADHMATFNGFISPSVGPLTAKHDRDQQVTMTSPTLGLVTDIHGSTSTFISPTTTKLTSMVNLLTLQVMMTSPPPAFEANIYGLFTILLGL